MATFNQDWEEVTLRKGRAPQTAGAKNVALAQAARAGAVTTERKFTGGTNASAHHQPANARKLDEETEEFKHQTVDRSLAQAIQQGRLAKGMTQKQLGTAINEKPQVVAEYESGKAIPNPAILTKLDRALGIHLPRPPKKNKKRDDA
ncbi:unnamed protein product [Phaeothamnion confervicola]